MPPPDPPPPTPFAPPQGEQYRHQLRARHTAQILLNLHGSAEEFSDSHRDLIDGSRAVEPVPFQPGTGSLACDQEKFDSLSGRKRNMSLSHEARMSIR